MSKSSAKSSKTSSKSENKKQIAKSVIAFIKSERFKKIRGVFYILFSVFLLAVIVSYIFNWNEGANIGGTVGNMLGELFVKQMFGITSLCFVLLFFVYGARLLTLRILPFWKTFWIAVFWMTWGSIFLGYINSFTGDNALWLEIYAGTFGVYVAKALNSFIGALGTLILCAFSFIVYLVFVHNLHFKGTGIINLGNKVKDGTSKAFSSIKTKMEKEDDDDNDENEVPTPAPISTSVLEDELDEKEMQAALDFEIKEVISTAKEEKTKTDITNNDILDSNDGVEFEINDTGNVSESAVTTPTDNEAVNDEYTADTTNDDMRRFGLDEPYDPTLELHDYKLPTVDMLVNYEERNTEVTKEELLANKNRIVETLKNFSIDIVRITASPGPTVTLYEIVPAPGIKISKIKNLEDDIALSLAALGIRIIAPIPGKGTIGIEVPNANPQIVSMKTMLTSDKFLNNKFELPIAIGKTISNEPYVADLCKMPHLLMAGATGQGKSVGLNAIIASLLYKKHPAELKFIMVDPKKVELSLYNKIERHYLAKLPDSEEAIITDTRKVVRTLNSLCIEMDNRYELLKKAQVKNIKEYNPKFISRRLNPENGHRYLPYIVVVVDEFADLIMTAGKEVEHPIARIAQLARAVGIHLIIATQRPSVNIITGTIKANFPARIAFRVTSKIDSRTILDTGGADQLIGRGDMLLSSGSEIVRLQCALIDTEEIEQVADYIGSQRGYPECFLLPEYIDEESEPSKEFDPKQKDEFFEEAARLVVASQHGSTSLLQRKLQLGYNRAGRIIDQLEAAGVVGPFEGSKAREVLIKTEAELVEHLRNLNY